MDIYSLLIEALEKLKAEKPNDHSALDRYYAVCITDTERLLAYFAHFIDGNQLPEHVPSEGKADDHADEE